MEQNLLYIALCAAMLSACHQPEKAAPAEDLLATNMDTTVLPAQDFFHYANGGWLKRNPIPNDETKWGIGNKVKEELYSRLKNINELAVKKTAKIIRHHQQNPAIVEQVGSILQTCRFD